MPPAAAAVRALPTGFAPTVGICAAAVSAFAFFVYWDDKRRAQRGDWRTPESVLHFLEFAGGWPGAMLARAWLRHKSSKTSFRIKSWLQWRRSHLRRCADAEQPQPAFKYLPYRHD
ncbi:MAG: DUF1294 domain-containing protein [Betaproteobacteria bacterium]